MAISDIQPVFDKQFVYAQDAVLLEEKDNKSTLPKILLSALPTKSIVVDIDTARNITCKCKQKSTRVMSILRTSIANYHSLADYVLLHEVRDGTYHCYIIELKSGSISGSEAQFIGAACAIRYTLDIVTSLANINAAITKYFYVIITKSKINTLEKRPIGWSRKPTQSTPDDPIFIYTDPNHLVKDHYNVHFGALKINQRQKSDKPAAVSLAP